VFRLAGNFIFVEKLGQAGLGPGGFIFVNHALGHGLIYNYKRPVQSQLGFFHIFTGQSFVKLANGSAQSGLNLSVTFGPFFNNAYTLDGRLNIRHIFSPPQQAQFYHALKKNASITRIGPGLTHENV